LDLALSDITILIKVFQNSFLDQVFKFEQFVAILAKFAFLNDSSDSSNDDIKPLIQILASDLDIQIPLNRCGLSDEIPLDSDLSLFKQTMTFILYFPVYVLAPGWLWDVLQGQAIS